MRASDRHRRTTRTSATACGKRGGIDVAITTRATRPARRGRQLGQRRRQCDEGDDTDDVRHRGRQATTRLTAPASITLFSSRHINQQTPGENGLGGWERTTAMGDDDRCGRRWKKRRRLRNDKRQRRHQQTTINIKRGG